MSASAWDQAVEAAAEALYEAGRPDTYTGSEWDWPNIDHAYDWDGDYDEHGDPEGQSPEWLRDRYRAEARAALAAALPVLLEELAQRIEAEERLPYAMQRHVRYADVRIVRGFAAEVTQ